MSNSINTALPALSMGQPTECAGYIIVARDLLHGVKVLSTSPNVSSRSCALIAAHALECALKAYLWHKGKKKEIRAYDVQHDLVVLWNMAYKKGLNIPHTPPDWVIILSAGHWPNFYFRYQEGEKDQEAKKTVVHGGQTPTLVSMVVELKNLIEMVGLIVKG